MKDLNTFYIVYNVNLTCYTFIIKSLKNVVYSSNIYLNGYFSLIIFILNLIQVYKTQIDPNTLFKNRKINFK